MKLGFLQQVVAGVPEAVQSEGEVHHLAEFFTSRLTDWCASIGIFRISFCFQGWQQRRSSSPHCMMRCGPCHSNLIRPSVQGALHGCLALLRRGAGDRSNVDSSGPHQQQQQQQQACLLDEDAVAMLRTATTGVYVRSLAQAGRQLALELLQAAAAVWGQVLLDAGLNLLEWAVASADGEKDPRCLLAALDGLATLLALYSRQPEHSLHAARLEEALEEAFDVVACYFPVSFTPPPGSPHAITRAQLVAALERALTSCPAFAPQLLPLLMEKLSSTLRRGRAGRGRHEEAGSRGPCLLGCQPAAARL